MRRGTSLAVVVLLLAIFLASFVQFVVLAR